MARKIRRNGRRTRRGGRLVMKCKEIEFINYNGGIDNLKIQNTALLRGALTEYLHSNCDDIYEAYGRPSA